MEAIFLIAAIVVASICLLLGAVPDPWVIMGTIRRDCEPRRFYFVVGGYVLIGALMSLGSWLANDRAKDATSAGSQPSAQSKS
ncbi:MAG: hypothetical protein M3Q52_07345 [Pseudomonadota bacterium]|nr:hypothetical protein [Pseudomonadota bacterium]